MSVTIQTIKQQNNQKSMIVGLDFSDLASRLGSPYNERLEHRVNISLAKIEEWAERDVQDCHPKLGLYSGVCRVYVLQRCNAVTPERARNVIDQLVDMANRAGLSPRQIKQTIHDAANHVRESSMTEITRHGIFAQMLDAAWRNDIEVHKFAMKHFVAPSQLTQDIGEPTPVRQMRQTRESELTFVRQARQTREDEPGQVHQMTQPRETGPAPVRQMR
jgi:hypothetical protein